MKQVILVCGVPGSGKSWVCSKFALDAGGNPYKYVPHDDHIKGDYVKAIVDAYEESNKKILADCPFAERELKEKLEKEGFTVKPVFIIEPTEVVKKRYFDRTGKELPKASVTRSVSIKNRVDEWKAPQGTSEKVLEMLRRGEV